MRMSRGEEIGQRGEHRSADRADVAVEPIGKGDAIEKYDIEDGADRGENIDADPEARKSFFLFHGTETAFLISFSNEKLGKSCSVKHEKSCASGAVTTICCCVVGCGKVSWTA